MITFLFRTLLLLVFLVPCQVNAAVPGVAVFSTKGSFEDVKERSVMAIENRGLVLNNTSRIGDMLKRTGKDIGRTVPIYGKAEMIEFCSARVSRETMQANPHNIVFCPYGIAIYTLPDEPGKVYVSYRKSVPPGPESSGQSVKALGMVDTLLEEIVREAIK